MQSTCSALSFKPSNRGLPMATMSKNSWPKFSFFFFENMFFGDIKQAEAEQDWNSVGSWKTDAAVRLEQEYKVYRCDTCRQARQGWAVI